MLALKDRDMDHAEYQRQVHRITPPAGTTIEDVKRPEYWVNVAGRIRHFDKIEVLPEDAAFHAELLVTGKGAKHVNVAVLHHVPLDGEAVEASPVDYVTEFGGPKHLHRVKRVSDGVIVKHGFSTKPEALAYIRSLESTPA